VIAAVAGDDGEYEGSEDADDDLQHLSLEELQQMQQQMQQSSQQRQLIPSSSGANNRQQQQQRQREMSSMQQQQQRTRSRAGQLTPVPGSDAGSSVPPAPAKTGLRKWFG
jgi:ATPase subunit of ABC transporter with duplicated ATPase domains